MHRLSKLLGGVLLVSGTTIGAAMLALPVSTGLAGFFPSLLSFFIVWLVMTFSALMMLEVTLWEEGETNFISMVSRTLGVPGKIFSWLAYLFLLYALTTAYIAGSGPVFIDLFRYLSGYALPKWAGSIPLLLIFGFFVYKGTQAVDRVNRLLMMGLLVTYVALLVLVTPEVDVKLLYHSDWRCLTIAASVIATSFGFHIIIPSLSTYLDRDARLLSQSIWIGSFIPLIVYIAWLLISLGVLPLEGEFGIAEAYCKGFNGAQLLSVVLSSKWIALLTRFFSFFAIVTSFLGVALSLSDFLADGLKIKKTQQGRVFLYLLTFVPPLVISLTNPRAFLSALEYAGAYGVVTLLVLVPALMVWVGRYRRGLQSTLYRAPGGKLLLAVVIVFAVCVIVLETLSKLGYLEAFITKV